MKSPYTGVLWHCDACGSETMVAVDNIDETEFPAQGVTGTTRAGISGDVWEWYACTQDCIPDAVHNAYQRLLDPAEPS